MKKTIGCLLFFAIFQLLLLASCTPAGTYHTYSYVDDNNDTIRFTDERMFNYMGSTYIMPKKRTKQERFQNLPPSDLIAK